MCEQKYELTLNKLQIRETWVCHYEPESKRHSMRSKQNVSCALVSKGGYAD